MKEILDKFCPKTSFDEDPFVGEALKKRRKDLKEALNEITMKTYKMERIEKEKVASSIICNKLGKETFRIFDDLEINIAPVDIYEMVYNHFEKQNEKNTIKKETRQTMGRDSQEQRAM